MKDRKLLTGTIAAVGMLMLILDGKAALRGAAEGINLCVRTVVPSLFPFFVLSIGLVGSWTGLAIPPLKAIGKQLRIPPGAESVLIPGFLGGYPVGAQAISECYRRRQLTASDAEALTAFCNNAGPAFIFGILSQFFPNAGYCWLLWMIHIVSAGFVAAVLPRNSAAKPTRTRAQELSLSDVMNRSLRATATVCGWVTVFRVILTFLDRWFLWSVPTMIRPLIIGIIELTNGCCTLSDIQNIGLRMIIASAILSFGGLSVWMQTASVLTGLSIRKFAVGKILQTVFSVTLTFLIQILLPTELRCFGQSAMITGVLLTGIAAVYFLIILRIRCSNHRKCVV